jgi:putative FmdB family regulatory protein
MPTYGFRCPDGHEFDRFYKTMSAAPTEVACPECGKVGARQMHGGAGLLFKGSGFYLTDYGKNAHRGDAKADTKSDTKPDTKSDKKADTKTETKADSKPKAESPKSESKPAKQPKAE